MKGASGAALSFSGETSQVALSLNSNKPRVLCVCKLKNQKGKYPAFHRHAGERRTFVSLLVGQRAVWSAHLGFIPAPWLIQANSRLSFSLHICKMGLISKPIPFLRGVDVRMKGENLIEYLVQCMATERHQKC